MQRSAKAHTSKTVKHSAQNYSRITGQRLWQKIATAEEDQEPLAVTHFSQQYFSLARAAETKVIFFFLAFCMCIVSFVEEWPPPRSSVERTRG